MAKRNSKANFDPHAISNQTYNDQAGAQKNTEVGANLKPIRVDGTTYSTDTTTARNLGKKGANLAIYNNAGAVGAVTLGKTAAEVATALAAGVCDATGHVGIACKPNDWTFVACYDAEWIKGTAATLLVYIINDDTFVNQN